MATKNLVPRANNEGELGISTRKWKGINSVSGSFEEIRVSSLKDSSGQSLIEAGTGVSIVEEANKITINASGGSAGNTDKIEEGDSSVEVVDNVDTSTATEIIFKMEGQKRWSIDANGHFLPAATDLYNIGGPSYRVNQLHLETDALIFKSQNVLESRLNVTDKSKLQFGVLTANSTIAYDNIVTAKADVRVATVENFVGTYELILGKLTATASSALVIDDITLLADDRVLLKDQTTETQNGIYKVLVTGSNISAPILERTLDFSEGSDFSNVKVSVLEGTKNSQKIFFTVPTTSGESLTQTNNLKWLDISGGGGGLEKVEDDLAPKLGGNLDVNNKSIINSADTGIIVKTNDLVQNYPTGGIMLMDNNTTSNTYGKHNYLQIMPPTDTDVDTTSRLSFISSNYSNFLHIEFDPSLWHISQSLGLHHSFRFPELVQNEKDNGFSTFATQEWVTHQGYATNAIQTADNASLTSLLITNMGTDASNAATKSYVDSKAMGVSKVLDTCKRTTVDAISTFDASYDSANKSFTSVAQVDINTSIDFDSKNTSASPAETDLVFGDRILVKDQTNATQNGIYKVIAVGTLNSASWVLERTSDFDTDYEANGTFVFVTEGIQFGSNGFVCTSPTTADTVGTDNISFAINSAASRTTVADPLTKSNSNQISLNLDGKTLGLIDTNTNGTADKLGIKLDSSLPLLDVDGINANDLIYVADSSSANSSAQAKIQTITNYTQKKLNANIIKADNQFTSTYTIDTSNPLNDTFDIKLTKKAITAQTEYNPDASVNGEVQSDDYLLIADTSDATDTNLRKIKVEDLKIKNFDIHSLPAQTAANELSSNDEIAVYDIGTSKNIKVTITELSTLLSSTGSGSLTYKKVENQSTDLALDAIANMHYHIIQNDPGGNIKYTLDLVNTSGQTFTAGDMIKVTMSPKNQYELNPDHASFTQSGSDNIVQVTFSANTIVSYNQNDLVRPLELVYDGTEWTSSLSSTRESFNQADLTQTSIGNDLTSPSDFNKYSNYFVNDDSVDLTFNIDSAANALSYGFKAGDKKTIYFTHSANTSVIITSAASDILTKGTAFGSDSNTKTIKFTNEGVNKVCLTLVKVDVDSTTVNSPRWIIEYVLDSAPSGLPAGDDNDVLKSDGTTWSGGKITSENMSADSVTGGTDANSIIGSKTIVGGDAGNIADYTIDNKQLVKRANKKVLGVLTTNTTASQEVGDIDVVTDLGDSSNTFNDTNLVTAKAIRNYVSNEIQNVSSPETVNIEMEYKHLWTAMEILPNTENIIPAQALLYHDPIFSSPSQPNLITSYVYTPINSETWTGDGRALVTPNGANTQSRDGILDTGTKVILPKVGHLYDTLIDRQNNNIKTRIALIAGLRKTDDDPSLYHLTSAVTNYPFALEISKDDVSAIDFWKYYGHDGDKINPLAEMRSSTPSSTMLVSDSYVSATADSCCYVSLGNNEINAKSYGDGNLYPRLSYTNTEGISTSSYNLKHSISYSSYPKELFTDYDGINDATTGLLTPVNDWYAALAGDNHPPFYTFAHLVPPRTVSIKREYVQGGNTLEEDTPFYDLTHAQSPFGWGTVSNTDRSDWSAQWSTNSYSCDLYGNINRFRTVSLWRRVQLQYFDIEAKPQIKDDNNTIIQHKHIVFSTIATSGRPRSTTAPHNLSTLGDWLLPITSKWSL